MASSMGMANAISGGMVGGLGGFSGERGMVPAMGGMGIASAVGSSTESHPIGYPIGYPTERQLIPPMNMVLPSPVGMGPNSIIPMPYGYRMNAGPNPNIPLPYGYGPGAGMAYGYGSNMEANPNMGLGLNPPMGTGVFPNMGMGGISPPGAVGSDGGLANTGIISPSALGLSANENTNENSNTNVNVNSGSFRRSLHSPSRE